MQLIYAAVTQILTRAKSDDWTWVDIDVLLLKWTVLDVHLSKGCGPEMRSRKEGQAGPPTKALALCTDTQPGVESNKTDLKHTNNVPSTLESHDLEANPAM